MQPKLKMSKEKLTILTVNYNTSDFVGLILYSLKKLTSNKYKVIICDNGSNNKHLIALINAVKQYDNIEIIFRQQRSAGSIAHGEALDLLVSKVETDYFVVMDSDAVFLKKCWDEILISSLNEKVKVVGSTLPIENANKKPCDFPMVFAALFETATFMKMNASFKPGNLIIDKSEDTGWEIRDKYIKNGYSGITFDSYNTKFTKDAFFNDIYCAVYYYKKDLIASHFARGSSDGVAKYNNKWYFRLPLLSRFIRKYIGKRERREWINKCYEIVDS